MSNEEYRELIQRMLSKIDNEYVLHQIFEYTQRKFLEERNLHE